MFKPEIFFEPLKQQNEISPFNRLAFLKTVVDPDYTIEDNSTDKENRNQPYHHCYIRRCKCICILNRFYVVRIN